VILAADRITWKPARGQEAASPVALRARTKLRGVQEEHAQAIIVLMSCPPVEFERSLVPPSSENRAVSKGEGALECVF
jgi:hypothetical protein